MEPGSLDWAALVGRAALPFGAGVLGGVAGAFGSGKNRALSAPLVYFAAGAFLGIALLNLLPEAARQVAWPGVLAGALVGSAVCAFLTRWAGSSCPACVSGHHHHDRTLELTTPMLAVVALHSVLDGLPLAEREAPESSLAVLSLAILIHKFPEGLAVAAISRAAGRSTGGAIALTAAVEACTFLGVLLGVGIDITGGTILGVSLAAVAGSFVYLAAFTLRSMGQGERPALNAGLAAAGAALILVARVALGGGG